MSSRTSQWRHFNQQLIQCLESDSDAIENDQDNQNTADLDLPSVESSTESLIEEMDILSEAISDPSSYNNDSDSSYESVENNTNQRSLCPDLASWAVSQNISHSALNSLLKILQNHHVEGLPSDARTLLKTPRKIEIVKKSGGEYIYLGIKSGILCRSSLEGFKKVSLIINIDGLPLFKSSDLEVWPILGRINGGTPFVISLWSGSGKPTSLDEYLKDFLSEYDALCQSGIEIREAEVVTFDLQCFSCDAPARQFLKCIKSHTGYYSCERCLVKGERQESTMTFEDTDCALRTDKDFADLNYPNHQHEKSALINHGIQCVSQFVLDYMHLVCLGVVKRILYFLQGGPRTCKLSQGQLAIISSRLNALRNQLPSEFARQPRGLKHLKRWKATEFKQFLLYTGMIVLKGIVSKELYDHFVSLTVSISVLMYFKPSDEEYMELFSFTKQLLVWFVEASPGIYGKKFVVYNVHNLIHLHQDVEKHQCGLESLSAFPFENFLYRIKKMIRKSHQPLSQLAKRITEIEESDFMVQSKLLKMKIQSNVTCGRNSWFLFTNNKIGEVLNVDDIYLKIKSYSFTRSKAFFEQPINSKLMKICFLPNNFTFKIEMIPRTDILCKFVCMIEEDGVLLVPILHLNVN